ncbi:MAG TPA: thioredoxin domain-containing protein [Rhizomicrobium sp.]
MSNNQLGQSASPHLLEHKDNPVDWRLWGPEAFAEAEACGKPIMLSIGYSACHWCHVMNAESFSDPETAVMINANFIPIKVDREERPDIDQLYQAAANILGHGGGWPLTMFLNARGEPFFAAGYMPAGDLSGQQSFKAVLGTVNGIYADKKPEIADAIARLTQTLNQTYNSDFRPASENVSLDIAGIRIGQRFDLFMGGVIGPKKFPAVPQIEFLWRSFLRTGSQQYMQLVAITLDSMLQGGLCDHLGGGFTRYVEDERWTVPHFEKMLCDNAQIIDLATMVWQFNRNKLCADTVRNTIEWLLRDMKVKDAFAASVDSDSEGEDGKYYLWTEEEVDTVLKGTFAVRFKTIYNVLPQGPYPGGRNALHRIGTQSAQLSDADEALLAKQRERMLAARGKRMAPQRDGKVLADWNGLAIAAIANAGAVFNRPEWTAAAVRAFDFIVKTMGDGDRLVHSWADGKRGAPAIADDYANMARAAIHLWEATGDKRFVEQAKNWVRVLNERFWDAKGGYNFTADDAPPLFLRIRMAQDNSGPAANGVMLSVLGKLWAGSGEGEYSTRGVALVQALSFVVNRNLPFSASFLNGFETFASGLNIIVIGPKDNIRTHELARVIWSKPLPNRLLTILAPDDKLPPTHPAFGKTMVNGQPTVYVSQRSGLSRGFTDPVELDQLLQLPQNMVQQQRKAS